jgi:hypothetical protein
MSTLPFSALHFRAVSEWLQRHVGWSLQPLLCRVPKWPVCYLLWWSLQRFMRAVLELHKWPLPERLRWNFPRVVRGMSDITAILEWVHRDVRQVMSAVHALSERALPSGMLLPVLASPVGTYPAARLTLGL